MKIRVLLILLVVILAGCKNQTVQPSELAQPTPVAGVTIQISNVTPVGATVTITDTNQEPYVYGEWFQIQRMTDGQWEDVPTVTRGYAFSEIGYLPDGKGAVEFNIDWEWLYGELPAGTYRIFKLVNFQEISIEFII